MLLAFHSLKVAVSASTHFMHVHSFDNDTIVESAKVTEDDGVCRRLAFLDRLSFSLCSYALVAIAVDCAQRLRAARLMKTADLNCMKNFISGYLNETLFRAWNFFLLLGSSISGTCDRFIATFSTKNWIDQVETECVVMKYLQHLFSPKYRSARARKGKRLARKVANWRLLDVRPYSRHARVLRLEGIRQDVVMCSLVIQMRSKCFWNSAITIVSNIRKMNAK